MTIGRHRYDVSVAPGVAVDARQMLYLAVFRIAETGDGVCLFLQRARIELGLKLQFEQFALLLQLQQGCLEVPGLPSRLAHIGALGSVEECRYGQQQDAGEDLSEVAETVWLTRFDQRPVRNTGQVPHSVAGGLPGESGVCGSNGLGRKLARVVKGGIFYNTWVASWPWSHRSSTLLDPSSLDPFQYAHLGAARTSVRADLVLTRR